MLRLRRAGHASGNKMMKWPRVGSGISWWDSTLGMGARGGGRGERNITPFTPLSANMRGAWPGFACKYDAEGAGSVPGRSPSSLFPPHPPSTGPTPPHTAPHRPTLPPTRQEQVRGIQSPAPLLCPQGYLWETWRESGGSGEPARLRHFAD